MLDGGRRERPADFSMPVPRAESPRAGSRKFAIFDEIPPNLVPAPIIIASKAIGASTLLTGDARSSL